MILAERLENQAFWKRKVRVHAAAFMHQAARSTFEEITTFIDFIKERPPLSSLTDSEGREIAQGILVNGIFYKIGDEEGFVIPRQTDMVRPLTPGESLKPHS